MSNKNNVCPNCKGQLQYLEKKRVYECPYCGYSEPVIESDQVQIEKMRMEHEFNKEQLQIQESIRKENKEEFKQFKKSKFSKVIIIFDIICALFMMSSFSDGHILKGLVALLQVAAFTSAWMSGAGIIKEKFSGMHTALAIAGFILIIPFCMIPNNISHKANTEHIAKINEEVQELDKAAENDVSNEDKVEVKSDETIAASDSEENEDKSSDDSSNNTKENILDDESSNIEEEQESDLETVDVEEEEEILVDGMRPEFKESMDSYEAFFDEYIAFMKKYSENSNNAISMIGEYTKFMTKYTEAMEKMDAMEDEELNDVELSYYIEVTARINKKLLSIGQ